MPCRFECGLCLMGTSAARALPPFCICQAVSAQFWVALRTEPEPETRKVKDSEFGFSGVPSPPKKAATSSLSQLETCSAHAALGGDARPLAVHLRCLCTFGTEAVSPATPSKSPKTKPKLHSGHVPSPQAVEVHKEHVGAHCCA